MAIVHPQDRDVAGSEATLLVGRRVRGARRLLLFVLLVVCAAGLCLPFSGCQSEQGPREGESGSRADAARLRETVAAARPTLVEAEQRTRTALEKAGANEIEEGHLAIVQAELDSVTNTGAWFDWMEVQM